MFRLRSFLVLILLLVFATPLFAQDLSQEFTTADGSLTFNYPRGWDIFEGEGSITIINDSDVAVDYSQLERGQARMFVFQQSVSALGLDADATPTDVLRVLARQASPNLIYDRPTEITIGRHEAARSNVTSSQLRDDAGIDQQESVFVLIPGEDVAYVAMLMTLPEEHGDFEEEFTEVLATFLVGGGSSPVETVTLPFGGDGIEFSAHEYDITLMHPDGWFVEEDNDGVITLSNERNYEWPVPLSGEEVIIISPFADLDFSGLDMDPKEFLALIAEDSELTYGEPEDYMIGDQVGARMSLETDVVDWSTILVFMGDDSALLVNFVTAPGEFDVMEPVALEILQSINFGGVTFGAPTTVIDPETPNTINTVDTSDLTETFTSDFDTIQFDHPDTWTIEELLDGGLITITSRDMTRSEVLVSILVMPRSVLGVGRNATPAEALGSIVSGENYKGFTEPEEFTIGGTVIARSQGVLDNGDDTLMLVVSLSGGDFAFVYVFSPSGNYEEFEETIIAMTSTIQTP